MFSFFKPGAEFSKLAITMGKMYNMLNEHIQKVESQGYYNGNDKEELLVLSYIAKRGILDRLEKYQWPPHTKISIPDIQLNRIMLVEAVEQTVGRLSFFADKYDMLEVFSDVYEGGQSYWELDELLPNHFKRSL